MSTTTTQVIEALSNGSADTKSVPQALHDKLVKGGIIPDRVWRHGEKPNIALWVTKDHQIYQEEIPYPICGPNDW
ncbi:hypothetical protein D9758_004207 [Tetrapyrgos nigripes]|uniref:Uncharacterized protein n=1 Tax=Tetrapyrgos nigripes TaxID=182062 RepID=A0A8H5LVQ7_9AGAR|nr:hypothetical protein D9758_004207 [Tetrapyrgos nigripes]